MSYFFHLFRFAYHYQHTTSNLFFSLFSTLKTTRKPFTNHGNTENNSNTRYLIKPLSTFQIDTRNFVNGLKFKR